MTAPHLASRPSRCGPSFAGALLAVALLASGCGLERRDPQVEVAGLDLVPASHEVRRQCERAARELGYAVPCPGVLPEGSYSTPPLVEGCRLRLVGPGCFVWRRWFAGSIEFPSKLRVGHLIVQGSPRPRSPVRFVYGPAWWPEATVEIIDRERVHDRTVRWIEVPDGPESLFGGHLLLMWTESGHTYGIGFHGYDSGARELGLAIAGSVTMVEPS